MLNDLLYRLRAFFRRRSVEQELDDELRFHMERNVQKLTAAGMTADEAQRRARMELGGVAQAKEETRQSWGIGALESLSQDIGYSLRTLRKTPAFTAVVVLSLALGIGANTAIFTLMDAVLWRMLPVKDPEKLMSVGLEQEGRFSPGFNYDRFKLLRDNSPVADIGGFATAPINVTIGSEPEPTVQAHLVSGGYFALLGVTPIVGRAIGPEDDRLVNGHPVVMLSYRYWERRFGRDPQAVGRTIRLLDTPFTIIGIAPPEFHGAEVGADPDLFAPIAMQPTLMPSFENLLEGPIVSRTWVQVIARPHPNVAPEQAAAALDLSFQTVMTREIAARNAAIQKAGQTLPNPPPAPHVALRPAIEASVLRRRFESPLLILLGMVGILLLIACANTANLLLARASSRRPEFAMRLAMGAGRGRLIRQLLVESMTLATLGGAGGVLLAWSATRLLVIYLSSGRTPVSLDLAPNLRVLGFTLAVSLVTGVLFGLAPAWRSVRIDLSPALKSLGKALLVGRRGLRAGKALAVAQVALSIVLLIGAGLFARTLQNLNGDDSREFRDSVLIARVEPRGSDQRNIPGTTERLDRTYRALLDRVRAIPGVRSASMTQGRPSSPRTSAGIAVTKESGERYVAPFLAVYADYFATIGMPIIAGRDFNQGDLSVASSLVCIVNETFVRFKYPNENPIGKPCAQGRRPNPETFRPDRDAPMEPYTIVGVVRDSRYTNPAGETEPVVYTTFLQLNSGRGQNVLHVRISGNMDAMISRIRQEVASVDPSLPLFDIFTLEQEMNAALVGPRLMAVLSGLFGGLALVLACVGLYGLLAYSVAQRQQEVGVRMALGARRGQVVWMVMREAAWLVGIGILVGAPAAWGVIRVARNQIEGLLFGLRASDPMVITAAILLLGGVAGVAAYLPARRAARVDPMVALRSE